MKKTISTLIFFAFIFNLLIAPLYAADNGCPSCGNTDKLTAIVNAKGKLVQFEYDLLGRLIRETDPFGNSIEFSYDSRGNIIKKKDQLGNTTAYTYDKLSRLIKKTYADDSIEEFKYDSRGNIVFAANQYIAYNLGYDSKSRLVGVADSNGSILKYEYDAMGNKVKLITPEEKTVSYKYDANNRLIEISSEGQIFTFTYDPNGRRTRKTYPNGLYTSYRYNSTGRLIELIHRNSYNPIINFAYNYDNVGNKLSKTEIDKKTTYTYDSLYRLTQAIPSKLRGKEKEFENKAENFSYDSVGNRLTGPERKDHYSYNEGSQLINDRKYQYEYDANGSLIKKIGIDSGATWTYFYDYENRLIKVVKQESGETIIASFKYDPFGRRIEKMVDTNDGTKVYNYVYDNEDIILGYAKTDDQVEITRFIQGLGIDEPLAIEQKGNIYYYHADSLGSIVALTDNRQKVVQGYTYDSFGNMKQSGEKVKQPYAFTSREWDEEIKLYFIRARYMDPKIGRFITKDPSLIFGNEFNTPYLLYEQLTTPQELNYYVFVGNNPVNKIDPLGLDDLSELDPNGTIGSPGGSILSCRQIAQRVSQEATQSYPWTPDERNNHMRHCWASCRVAQLGGSICSFIAGWARELRGVYDPADVEANAKGRKCALRGDCVKCCGECKP